MYKGYKAAKNKEDIGNALKRMQDNIVILQEAYSKASEIAKRLNPRFDGAFLN